ncbi:DUF3313 domain-containing protein [Myxococcota bacterium]|nr:DUF3313 domain-containing protein [Myxococcota bacterium]
MREARNGRLFPGGGGSAGWSHLGAAVLLACAVLVPGCAGSSAGGTAPADASNLENPARSGLIEVASRSFDGVWLRPDTQWSRYRRIGVEPLEFADPLDTGGFVYRERDFQAVGANFEKYFVRVLGPRALGRAKAGPGVLVLRCVLTRLIANRPPMGVDRERRGPSQEVSSAMGVGSVAMRLELRDSVSNELLAVVRDGYRGWPLGSNLQAVMVWGDTNRAFSLWARGLSRLLDGSGPKPD